MASDLLFLDPNCCTPCAYACTTSTLSSIDLTFSGTDCNGASLNRSLIPAGGFFDSPAFIPFGSSLCDRIATWSWEINGCPETHMNKVAMTCGSMCAAASGSVYTLTLDYYARLKGVFTFTMRVFGTPGSHYRYSYGINVKWAYQHKLIATLDGQDYSKGYGPCSTTDPYTNVYTVFDWQDVFGIPSSPPYYLNPYRCETFATYDSPDKTDCNDLYASTNITIPVCSSGSAYALNTTKNRLFSIPGSGDYIIEKACAAISKPCCGVTADFYFNGFIYNPTAPTIGNLTVKPNA